MINEDNERATITVSHTLKLVVQNIPSSTQYTKMGSIIMMGGNLYCLKGLEFIDNPDKQYACIVKISGVLTRDTDSDGNFADDLEESEILPQPEAISTSVKYIYKNETSTDTAKLAFKHVNGICYQNDNFLIADQTDKIHAINTTNPDHWYHGYTIQANKIITAITSYSGSDLIVCSSQTEGQRVFYLATITNTSSGRTLELLDSKKFMIKINKNAEGKYEFIKGNDIHFDKNTRKLYVTMFKEDSDGAVNKNRIYEVTIPASIPFGTTLSNSNILVDNDTDLYKYEIEGIAINPVAGASEKYISANVNLNNTALTARDAVYQLNY